MATRAIKPKRDDSLLTDWKPDPERAPSVVLESRPTWTRFLAMIGLLCTAMGVFSQVCPPIGYRPAGAWSS